MSDFSIEKILDLTSSRQSLPLLPTQPPPQPTQPSHGPPSGLTPPPPPPPPTRHPPPPKPKPPPFIPRPKIKEAALVHKGGRLAPYCRQPQAEVTAQPPSLPNIPPPLGQPQQLVQNIRQPAVVQPTAALLPNIILPLQHLQKMGQNILPVPPFLSVVTNPLPAPGLACSTCRKPFPGVEALQQHVARCRPVQPPLLPPPPPNPQPLLPVPRLVCSTCCQVFRGVEALQQHAKSCSPVTCSACRHVFRDNKAFQTHLSDCGPGGPGGLHHLVSVQPPPPPPPPSSPSQQNLEPNLNLDIYPPNFNNAHWVKKYSFIFDQLRFQVTKNIIVY